MFELNNKNVLVVGASSGIGETTAKVLAEQGANVILVARREERLKEICSGITTTKASYYAFDVTDFDNVSSLFDRIVSEQGKIDGLAYVAGISDGAPIKMLSYERHLEVFKTNYFGFVEFVRQATKKGRYNDGFRIVGVSSVSSMRGEKALVAYASSKAAMNSAVRCIAKELAPKGICINAVAPSIVKTQMYDSFVDVQGEDSSANTKAMERQYLGLARTSDVANSIVFLLSEEARFITGITMPVDGGFTST